MSRLGNKIELLIRFIRNMNFKPNNKKHSKCFLSEMEEEKFFDGLFVSGVELSVWDFI